ncbi:MAG: S9 family peptidase [Anaerovoracaceae bacterium]
MEKRLPEFEDISRFERFTGGDWCCSRGLLAYASSRSGGIVLKDLRSGEQRVVSVGGGEGSPRFSPDGSRMLFLASVPKEGRQLFCMELDSEKIRQVTHLAGAVMEPIWSPQGDRILFGAPISGGALPEKRHSDEAVVIEDFGYKFDGVGFIRPENHMQLYIADVDGGSVRCLTEGQCDYLHHNWMPDGRSVICVSDKMRSKEEGIGYDLLLIDADEDFGRVRRLTEGLWLVSYPNPMRPVPTPDGKYVIAGILDIEDEEKLDGSYPEVYLYRIPAAGGRAEKVFVGDETCYQCVQFPYNAGSGWGFDKLQLSEDGKEAYFVSGWQGQCNIYRLNLEGDGHAELLSGGKQVYHGLGRVQDGKMLITRAEADVPEQYCIMDCRTGEILQTAAQSAEDTLEQIELSKPEDFFFNTLDGESRVHGWVLPPQRMEKGKKYPTILYIHGGPHPFYTYGLTMEYQCFAAAGFDVVYCNPRGSSGYGKVHQNIVRSTDGSAYYDCLQFVEEAARRFPWIDTERMGVTGGSYGGYMVNYMAAHSSRFKAYITQRSVASDLISYASSDMQGSSKAYQSFEEFMVNSLKSSAVSYAEKIDRPFLILHGTEDYRTPVEGAHQLFVAIKDLHPDLPVKMVLFPHTGHDQPQIPALQKIYYDEMIEWFRKYL